MNEEYGWFRPQDLPILFEALRATPSGGILVGGQSLTFWVRWFNIPIPQTSDPFLTQDADILGTAADAEIVAKKLNATLRIPEVGDHTPNTAIVTYVTEDGVRLFIDFMGMLIGVSDAQVKNTAIVLSSEETGIFKILHPRLVLISRLANLYTLGSKRNFNGITQARVAVKMIREFFDWYAMREGLQDSQRYYLNCFEWLFRQSLENRAILCYQRWGIDLMESARLDKISSAEFHSKRLPQVNGYLKKWRAKNVTNHR